MIDFKNDDQQIKPSIKVAVPQNFSDTEIVNEMLSGIEEESVPYDVIRLPYDEAVTLSFKAAQESVLDVGIGVDSNGIVAVHYEKLPSETPLFVLNFRLEREKIRSACSNAARLTKGVPFIL